ncbi:MAG: ABC transporter permease [Desulfurococcus sp.]|uniref:ABC transporter permease n=1 Tax=Desulfurococcus sp. TaxID=51678 RepID=UPI003163A34D
MNGFNAFASLFYRQVKRWASSRSRLISTIIQPLLWLVFLGLGFGGVFNPENINTSALGINATVMPVPVNVTGIVSKYFNTVFGGIDYVTFMVSGMVAMTAFMGSFIAGISVIWDKQFGFLKETLVAPAPRSVVIAGRIFGDAFVNTLQSAIIITLALLFTNNIRITGIPVSLLYVFIMAVGFTGLGTAISLKFSSMEGFQMIVNIITMPLMFMSGVFYPVKSMPTWMQYVAMFNPLTYAVHASRYWLTGADVGFDYMNPLVDIVVLSIISIVLLVVAMRIFERATIED